MATKIFGDLVVSGSVTAGAMTAAGGALTNSAISSTAAIARSKLAQDDLQPYTIPLYDVRRHDAPTNPLTGTANSDDLGFISITYGGAPFYISAGDCKAATITRYGRILTTLPPEYVTGESVVIRVNAVMKTTIADTSAVIDVECYSSDKLGTLTSELCQTAAQDMNSLSANEYDFTVNGALPLYPGDPLDIRVTIAVVDAATGTTVEPAIYSIEIKCDIKG